MTQAPPRRHFPGPVQVQLPSSPRRRLPDAHQRQRTHRQRGRDREQRERAGKQRWRRVQLQLRDCRQAQKGISILPFISRESGAKC